MAETIITESVVVASENGLHIRPAEQLARLANQFDSRIGLVYECQRVDAKSIMELLTLGAGHGASVVIEAQGSDATEAVKAISDLLEKELAAEDSPSE